MKGTLDRILIAVDESPSSDTAVDQALALAVGEGAEVVLAHVVSMFGEEFMPKPHQPDRVPERATTPVLTEAAAKAEAVGVPYTTELLVGYAPTQLAAVADDRDVDLIVVGSRHLTGLKRVLLGSTSRALLGETSRPVLIVPTMVREPAPVGPAVD